MIGTAVNQDEPFLKSSLQELAVLRVQFLGSL